MIPFLVQGWQTPIPTAVIVSSYASYAMEIRRRTATYSVVVWWV